MLDFILKPFIGESSSPTYTTPPPTATTIFNSTNKYENNYTTNFTNLTKNETTNISNISNVSNITNGIDTAAFTNYVNSLNGDKAQINKLISDLAAASTSQNTVLGSQVSQGFTMLNNDINAMNISTNYNIKTSLDTVLKSNNNLSSSLLGGLSDVKQIIQNIPNHTNELNNIQSSVNALNSNWNTVHTGLNLGISNILHSVDNANKVNYDMSQNLATQIATAKTDLYLQGLTNNNIIKNNLDVLGTQISQSNREIMDKINIVQFQAIQSGRPQGSQSVEYVKIQNNGLIYFIPILILMFLQK